jgi:plastocyanin
MLRAACLVLLAAMLLPAAPALPALTAAAPHAPAEVLGVALPDVPGPLLGPAERYLPRAPGTEHDLTYTYGPFPIPPGWDMSRLSLDVPLPDGFVTKLSWHLLDATGAEPNNMLVHIHHALWFTGAPTDLLNVDFNDFLFGTGEERTAYDLDAISAAQPGGPRYGLFFDSNALHTMLLMLHNKQTTPFLGEIELHVTFVHGTAQDIAAATGCDNVVHLLGERCAAGQDFHALKGRLWGQTYDVPRDPLGDDRNVWPSNPHGDSYVAQTSGTMVFGGGHLHPNGVQDVVVNLGPDAAPCGDLDHDGFPGITLWRSDKIDHNPLAWPHSEDYQMGITQPGFRAPIRAGDRIAQFGVYADRDQASYAAMAFAGMHIDPQQAPAPRAGSCGLADTAPVLLGGGDPTRSVPNRAFDHDMPVCGVPGAAACEGDPALPAPGVETQQVVIAGFTYVPGDRGLAGPLGQPPVIHVGQSLTFVNADTAGVIRHTVTSCAWPCNGPYVANYPQPSGAFDSERMGNADIFDGGSLLPPKHVTWSTPADLAPGLYSYYCRLHPWMRGAFEVVA